MSALLSSLAGFVSAGLRPRSPLAKAVVWALVIKLCAVMAIRFFMFNDESKPPVDSHAIESVLLGPTTLSPALLSSKGSPPHD